MSTLDTKRCTKCGVEQDLSCFSKSKTRADGRAAICKSCKAKYGREYRAANKERAAKSAGDYYAKNKEKIAAKKALYRAKNREKIRTARRAYLEKRRKEDAGFRLRGNLSSRLHNVLKSTYKYATTAMLGCTKTELMDHLESMFDGDMTWENYGLGGWEVDHIKPLAKFDLTDEEQLKQACHYTNLQPLWAFDNRSKGASYEEI